MAKVITFYGSYNKPWACFSQHYRCQFIGVDGIEYTSTEQYMMHQKAILFDDHDTAQKILETDDPKLAKKLGRKVYGFTKSIWDQYKFLIVVNGNYLKFSSNPLCKHILIKTKCCIIAEATKYDTIWGTGLSIDNLDNQFTHKWKGQNLLGKALMQVRSMLAV